MRQLLIDALLLALGVFAGRLIFTSLYKPSNAAAKALSYGVGLLIAAAFYVTWATTGLDPVQLTICSVFSRAPVCLAKSPESMSKSADQVASPLPAPKAQAIPSLPEVAAHDFKVAEIGKVEWTTSNINIPTEDSFCYNDLDENCVRFGRLYSSISARAACQSLGAGWRLPTESEAIHLSMENKGGYLHQLRSFKQTTIGDPTQASTNLRSASNPLRHQSGGGMRYVYFKRVSIGINKYSSLWLTTDTSDEVSLWEIFDIDIALHREASVDIIRLESDRRDIWASVRCVRSTN